MMLETLYQPLFSRNLLIFCLFIFSFGKEDDGNIDCVVAHVDKSTIIQNKVVTVLRKNIRYLIYIYKLSFSTLN